MTMTVSDLDVIEHLDFEPPCERADYYDGKCVPVGPAEWMVHFWTSCCDMHKTILLCGHCWSWFAENTVGIPGICHACHAYHSLISANGVRI